MKFTGACLVAAPLCFAGYGIVRLIGRATTEYSPGPYWTAGHLLQLIGLMLLVPAVLGIRRMLPSGWLRELRTTVTFVGLLASAAQFVVDLAAGLMATDKPGMSAITGHFSHLPGAQFVFYQAGPPLLYVGLFLLSIGLVRAGHMPAWSPVAIVVGSGLAAFSLDLLPLGAAALLAGLLPLALRLATEATDGHQAVRPYRREPDSSAL